MLATLDTDRHGSFRQMEGVNLPPLNEIVGLGAFIHGVCICNNIAPTDNLLQSVPAALRATAGFAIIFRMYYVGAVLLCLSEIIIGLKAATKEIRF